MEGVKKVLVVDDNADIRKLIRLWLEDAHYEVSEAKDGNDLLRKIKTHSPDLIILDLIMPGPSPPKLLSKIKNTLKGTPILYLSGMPSLKTAVSNDEFDIEIKPPIEGILLKPVDREIILKKVENVFKKK